MFIFAGNDRQTYAPNIGKHKRTHLICMDSFFIHNICLVAYCKKKENQMTFSCSIYFNKLAIKANKFVPIIFLTEIIVGELYRISTGLGIFICANTIGLFYNGA